MIKIKSKFFGWRVATYADALDYAKWKIKNIQTGKTINDRLELVNACLAGVQFTIQDLYGNRNTEGNATPSTGATEA